MSIEDIILDRVRDKLFYQLHPSLKHRLFGRQENLPNLEPLSACKPLKGWNIDDVSDAIYQIIEDNKDYINKTISRETVGLQNLEDIANQIAADLILKQQFQKHALTEEFMNQASSIEPESPASPSTANASSPAAGLSSSTSNPQLTSTGPTGFWFPFDTRSLLQMCWGLTLNFSHNAQQQAMGAIFNAQFEQMKQVFTPSLMTNLSDANGNFVLNLEMALSSCVRNMGFIRDTHMDYLFFNADRLNSRRQAIEQMADYASFSGSGLYSKIASFIGFGSVADLVTKLKLSLVWIPIFVIGGIVGAFAVTFIVRQYVIHTDDFWDWNMRKDQNRFWREHYKKDATDELYNFYLSIIRIIEKFYPQNATAIMNNDELLKLRKYPERVKYIIREQILAPDDLQWFPEIQASTTSSQSSTASGSGSSQESQGQSSDKSKTSSKGS
jgi:hypothetical protein